MLFIAGVTLITRDNTTWAYILLGLAFIYLLLTIFFRSKNREKNSEEKTIGIEAEGSIVNAPGAKIQNQDISIKSEDSIINIPNVEIDDKRKQDE